MKITLPLPVEKFRRQLLHMMHHANMKTSHSYIFGGCVRDFLMRKEPKDYDIILGHPTRDIKVLLRRAGIVYEEKPRSSHIFLDIEGYEVQMMEKLIVEYDFTINKFRASLDDLVIEGPEASYHDLRHKLLRAIDISPRMFRRCIYMLYKYPSFRPTPETLYELKRCVCNEEQIKSFIVKKQMKNEAFLAVCNQYGLASKASFLAVSMKDF